MRNGVQFFLSEHDSVKISPRLYGHFAEHLGRCCYDGLFVGENYPSIPSKDGFRTDVSDALAEMPTPLLRWPGGCYADHYHWRDGIGEPGKRPTRLGLSCGKKVVDENRLGTHEFLAFCEKIGAEPYLAGNMGSGSVQEMCDWVEYCNANIPTSLVKERRANGRQSPFGVKLWGVGNENWGCGGEYSAEAYGLEYRRYASMLKHVDPEIELVACGHDGAWNERLIPTLRHHAHLVNHYSIHRYWIGGGPGSDFTEQDYYRSLKEAEETEEFILETRQLLNEIDPGKKIGIALDEWGVWHPEARGWGPGALGDLSDEYFQAATQRDAIQAGIAFEVFHRQAHVLSLANLAQIVNVLHAPIQTAGTAMWTTPTYHLLNLHKPHIGQNRLKLEIESSHTAPDGSPSISGTASRGENATQVTLINRSFDEAIEMRIPEWVKQMKILAGPASAANSGDEPQRVKTEMAPIPEDRSFEFPPSSILALAG
jgi:alpha-N-arabinofuranosidase